MAAPNVVISEIDLTTRVPSFPGVYGGIVIPAKRGPIDEPLLMTSQAQFLKYYTLYDKPEIGFDVSYFSALTYLEKSNKLWVMRAAKNALYGGVFVRKPLATKPSGAIEFGTPDPTAYNLNTVDGRPYLGWTNFTVDAGSDDLIVSNSNFFNTITTGMPVKISSTIDLPSPLSSTKTYYIIKGTASKVRLATSYENAINYTDDNPTHVPLKSTGSGTLTLKLKNLDKTSIFTVNVEESKLTVSNNFYSLCANNDQCRVSVSPGGTLPTPLVSGTTYTITKVGTTTPTIILNSGGNPVTLTDDGEGTFTITLTNKEVSSTCTTEVGDYVTVDETFYTWTRTADEVKVRGSNLPNPLNANNTYYAIKSSSKINKIRFATSKDNALAGVAVDLTTTGSGVMEVTNTSIVEEDFANQKLFMLYGCNPGAWNNDVSVTIETNPAVVKENSDSNMVAFKISVFLANNLTTPVETFICSRIPGYKDGFGRNIYIEDVLQSSMYIRAINNTSIPGDVLPDEFTGNNMLNFANGSDGDPITAGDGGAMLLALDKFSNEERVPLTLIMDGGFTDPAYQKQGIIAICEKRKDCFGILSVDYAAESNSNYMNAIYEYRSEELNANTSFAALYSPHALIYDKYNDRRIYVPPDGYAAAAISETASNYAMWWPPAGFRRGMINVLDLRRRFSKGEMDYLYDNGINPLRFAPGRGILIWGQKTLLTRPSALDRINVRLLLIVIEPAIKVALEDFVFELNNAATRAQVKAMITTYLLGLQAQGAFNTDVDDGFYVVCDSTNNLPSDIDNNIMRVDIFIKPVRSIEYIKCNIVLTPTSMEFSTAASLV